MLDLAEKRPALAGYVANTAADLELEIRYLEADQERQRIIFLKSGK